MTDPKKKKKSTAKKKKVVAKKKPVAKKTARKKVYFTGVKNNKPTYSTKRNKNIIGMVSSTNLSRKKKKK